jgi:hypothetical protein
MQEDDINRSVFVICIVQWTITLIGLLASFVIVVYDATNGVWDWRCFGVVAIACAFHAWSSWFLRLAKKAAR